jgi:hypothetical protein
VAAQIRFVHGDDGDMASAGLDPLPAARTDIRLPSLKGVDAADLDRSAQRGISAHRRMRAMTAKAATTIT